MSPTITLVRPASDQEWDTIWSRCTYATYFHSRGWSEIWSDYSRGQIQSKPLILEFSDDSRALMPLSQEHLLGGLFKRTLSSPAGTYGGWISEHNLQSAHIELLTNWLFQHSKNIVWRQNPYAPAADAVSEQWHPDHTQVIDLSPGLENILSNWNRGHRSALNKALRSNIKTRLAKSNTDWHNYYLMYERSIRRWGDRTSSHYGQALFDILRERADSDDNIKLWIATHSDQIIAGALCVYGSCNVVYWHGAALASHFQLRPVNFLLHDVIRHASEHGLHWFDFNPSGGHSGVEQFKAGFGARNLEANIFRRHMLATRIACTTQQGFKNLKIKYGFH